MIKANIEATPGPYGFGKNWHLVLDNSKNTKSIWLGQDAKVASRVMGADLSSLADIVRDELGVQDIQFENRKVQTVLVRYLLSGFTGGQISADEFKDKNLLEQYLNQVWIESESVPWNFCAE